MTPSTMPGAFCTVIPGLIPLCSLSVKLNLGLQTSDVLVVLGIYVCFDSVFPLQRLIIHSLFAMRLFLSHNWKTYGWYLSR